MDDEKSRLLVIVYEDRTGKYLRITTPEEIRTEVKAGLVDHYTKIVEFEVAETLEESFLKSDKLREKYQL